VRRSTIGISGIPRPNLHPWRESRDQLTRHRLPLPGISVAARRHLIIGVDRRKWRGSFSFEALAVVDEVYKESR
jgi:hypothetical protein